MAGEEAADELVELRPAASVLLRHRADAQVEVVTAPRVGPRVDLRRGALWVRAGVDGPGVTITHGAASVQLRSGAGVIEVNDLEALVVVASGRAAVKGAAPLPRSILAGQAVALTLDGTFTDPAALTPAELATDRMVVENLARDSLLSRAEGTASGGEPVEAASLVLPVAAAGSAAPTVPAPVAPAPVAPAPVTPAPVAPAPVTPAPVAPAPVASAVVSPEPDPVPVEPPPSFVEPEVPPPPPQDFDPVVVEPPVEPPAPSAGDPPAPERPARAVLPPRAREASVEERKAEGRAIDGPVVTASPGEGEGDVEVVPAAPLAPRPQEEAEPAGSTASALESALAGVGVTDDPGAERVALDRPIVDDEAAAPAPDSRRRSRILVALVIVALLIFSLVALLVLGGSGS